MRNIYPDYIGEDGDHVYVCPTLIGMSCKHYGSRPEIQANSIFFVLGVSINEEAGLMPEAKRRIRLGW